MKRTAVSGIMLTLMLTGVILTSNIHPAEASGTIYIRADGSIDPPIAPISSIDNTTYMFTDNIYDSIVVERGNVIIDGDGHTLQGSGSGNGFFWNSINNVTVKRTNIRGFNYSIRLVSSSGDSIIENNIASIWDGIYLNDSPNNTLSGNNITAGHWAGIIFEISSGNTASNNIITNNGYGILLDYCYYGNIIRGNNITNNGNGIHISNSYNTDVFDNDISGNINPIGYGYGISVVSSLNTRISGNNIVDNREGIHFYASSRNIVSNNNIANHLLGIWLDTSSNNIVFRNRLTYNLYGIRFIGPSSNNSIENNIITNNQEGIHLNSNYNSILNNNISSNDIGINLWAWYNNITGNTLFNNTPERAIRIEDSNYNRIYHNNFYNVRVFWTGVVYYGNIWDDGYPSGGNYWSNYACVDLNNGANQDLPGGDGIGDTPYVIDANNKDRYPLMNPWTPTPPTIMASVDIDPRTLNLKSKGKWITAYIQLPEEYSVADIGDSTILLNGTIAPVLDPKYSFVSNSSEYLVDHNNDRILERLVKFDRAAVELFVCNQGIRYGNVALTLIGTLSDETSFEGTDVIFVNYAGDVNGDGTINILDTAAISAHWYPGPPIGPLSYDLNADFNRDDTVNVLDVGILSGNWGQTTPTPQNKT